MAAKMIVAELLARLSADTQEFDKGMKKAMAGLRRQAEDLTQAGRVISATVTAPLLAAGVAAGKTAMDFETAMTKIITLVGMTRGTIEAWTPTVRKMASEVGVSATELGEALFFITSAGIRTEAALEVLEASAKAAAIGLGETQKVAHAAVSAMNAYGESNLSAKEAVSVLIATVREGNMEAKTLPMAFGRVLPVAAELGVSFKDVGASIAMMTRSGVTARLAAFALRSVLMTMISPTHESNMAMHELGLTWEQIRQIATKDGLLVALQKIKQATAGNSEAFAQVIPNSRAFIGALQLVGKNAAHSETVFKSLADTTESEVDETFKEFSKTAKADLSKALASLSESAVILGESLTGITKGFRIMADSLNKVAEVYQKIPLPARQFLNIIVSSIATIGIATIALGKYKRLKASLVGITGMHTQSVIAETAAIRTSTAAYTAQQSAVLKMVDGMSKLSVAAAGFTIGLNIGRELDEWLGITEKLSEVFANAGDSVFEFGQAMAKNSELFNETQANTAAMAATLKDSRLEWIMNAEQTEDNAHKMARLNDELTKQHGELMRNADALKELTEAEKHHLEYMSDEQKLMAARLLQQAEYNEKVRKEFKLLTSNEVRDALDNIVKQYKNLKSQGIPLPVIWESMQNKIKETLGWAEKYNMELPKGVQAMKEELKQVQNIANDLAESYDLMTREQTVEAMNKIAEDYAKMREAGIPLKKIWEALAPKTKEALEWAKEYGIALPEGFRQMNAELLNEGIPTLAEWTAQLNHVPGHVDAMAGKVLPGMIKVGDTIANELKGGFGRGYDEGRKRLTEEQHAIKNQLEAGTKDGISQGFGKGFDEAKTKIDEFIEDLKERKIEIPVVPDEEVWVQFFEDLANGKIPDTGG